MIHIKTPEEIKIMAESGKILALIMANIKELVKPGITTDYLNRVAEDLVFKYGVKPAFKGYGGFPDTVCVSINEEIVHGIPSGRILKNGDIVSLDSGVIYKGFYSDMAITLPVGEINPETNRLLKTAKKALKLALKKIRPGNTTGDIGNTIQRYVEDQGFNVVRNLCGHGIGRELHEDPEILNYGKRRSGNKLIEGMVICPEPMVTMGHWKTKLSDDGFTFQTADNSLSAHFEHTVAVTARGCRILTSLE